MGLFKEYFHWHVLALVPIGVVGLVLGAGALFRNAQHDGVAAIFFALAGIGIAIRFIHAAVIAKDHSRRSRVMFAVAGMHP